MVFSTVTRSVDGAYFCHTTSVDEGNQEDQQKSKEMELHLKNRTSRSIGIRENCESLEQSTWKQGEWRVVHLLKAELRAISEQKRRLYLCEIGS